VSGRLVTVIIMIGAAAAVIATMGPKPAPSLVWNASESVPVGLYRVRPAGKLTVTNLVVALPPEPLATFLAEAGYLPRGVPLIKRILALPGQTVCRTGLAIMVDGIEMGMARERDSRGRRLPAWQGCRIVSKGEVFLMNWDEPASLDGRYFGPIAISSIIGYAEPLSTLTACALGVEPKLMHALIWHQSGGEPWAVSVQSEPNSLVYSSMQDAIRETRASSAGTGTVRVGLAGLAVDPSKVAPAVLLPCRNVAIAAGQIAKLADRCRVHPRLKTDPTFCAVAVYRGSWRQPDVKFGDAVATSVAKGDAPDFDMPKDTTIEFLDTASETTSRSDDPFPASVSAAEERERGWSSALFPSGPQPSAPGSDGSPSDHPPAEQAPSPRVSNAHPSTIRSPVDSLFVPRSLGRRPQ